MQEIKLVIWDLDDTFWSGTLSEGGIQLIKQNVEIVKQLTTRGIINSIVSKNHFEEVKEKLIEAEIWDYFVFPTVNWNPKGLQVKMVVESAQLRNTNVLFIDDNHLNLEETKFYNKDINVATPEILVDILSNPAFKGKDDKALSRLKQYKILESKIVAKSNLSNEEFLRASGIEIEIIENLSEYKERVLELINRSNQLNYTKKRLTSSDIELLIASGEYKNSAIKVVDKFGDYGIVGFYSLHIKDNRLEHFVFSCRILNIGVEQFVFSYLKFPVLRVTGEVVGELNRTSRPDWIRIKKDTENEENDFSGRLKLLFKGGCDLAQMLHYLDHKTISVKEEVNYVSPDNMPIHAEHSHIMLGAVSANEESKKNAINNIPFVDEQFFTTAVFNGDYNILIYSVLMDYTQDLYVERAGNFIVPFGGYQEVLTYPSHHQKIIEKYIGRDIKVVTQDFLNYFTLNFDHVGQISPDNFKRNLEAIRKKIPQAKPIIFVNGAEVALLNPKEPDAHKRHQIMNKVLDEFIAEAKNCYLIDVRKIITSQNQLTDNLRHYKREVYFDLAIELRKIIENKIGVRMVVKKKTLVGRLKRYFRIKLNQANNFFFKKH